MKSCFAGWNPNKFGWNLQPTASDEIKSASHISLRLGHTLGKTVINCFLTLSGRFATCRKADFIAKRFHPRKWIYSYEGGFSWKRLRIVSNPESFSGAGDRTWTCTGNHQILSLARLPIPPRPQASNIVQYFFVFVKGFLKFLQIFSFFSEIVLDFCKTKCYNSKARLNLGQ